MTSIDLQPEQQRLSAEANTLGLSIIIPTCGRPEEIATTLEGILAQTAQPAITILVDASPDDRTRAVAETFASRMSIRYERAAVPSAAAQRNQGAVLALTPLTAFMDDDITLRPQTCERICAAFAADVDARIGGIAARIEGEEHRPPSRLFWWYLRLQAGFSHPTYGGRLFGPAINCYPTYSESDADLIDADWLNSGCTFYRTDIFLRERFPSFEGYSFMEDVHLSARIAKTHRLYFHKTASCVHRDAGQGPNRNCAAIARMRVRNQRCVARDVLGRSGIGFECKFLLHRIFCSIAILRQHSNARLQSLWGTWF